MAKYLNSTIKIHPSGKLAFALIAVFLGSIFTSCTQENKNRIYQESNSNLVGLASFFQMKSGVDTLLIDDYFLHPELVDSIFVFWF